MKTVVILLLLLSPVCFSQADTMARHHACGQLGGQSFVSMHYEYSLIARKHFSLLTDVGVGINENADDTDYENHPAI